MAKYNNTITYHLQTKLDESGISRLMSMLNAVENKANTMLKGDPAALKRTIDSASTLRKILGESFDVELGVTNLNKFREGLDKNGISIQQLHKDYAALGSTGTTAFNGLIYNTLSLNKGIRQTSVAVEKMATTFWNTVRWGITAGIFQSITSEIREAFRYAKDLDTSLNDIRIVTDKSSEAMTKFAISSNRAAKELGAATTEYTNAALIYYQQGLGDAESQKRAEITVKAANVTGQAAEDVSAQLTAVWNGYKVINDETELYVDKLAAVAASTAADLEEQSVAMSKVASAASAMGVDFDQLNAIIATTVSVTKQAPESIGTAYKTIFSRLGDLVSAGESTDEEGFTVTLGQISTQLDEMGIHILDQTGNLRDMGDIVTEVGQKWQTWSRAQQQAAAIAMAGRRQYNNLIALFENWDMYSEQLTVSADAMGTLTHQNNIYLDSVEAHLQKVENTKERVYDALFDTDSINTTLDAFDKLLVLVANFVEGIGGGLPLLQAVGATMLQIFSGPVSVMAGKMAHNFRAMSSTAGQTAEAVRQMQLSYGDIDWATNEKSGQRNTAAQKMVELAQEVGKSSRVLTEELESQYNILLKQTNEYYNQQMAIEENKQKLQESYQQTFPKTGFEVGTPEFENQLNSLKALQEDLTKSGIDRFFMSSRSGFGDVAKGFAAGTRDFYTPRDTKKFEDIHAQLIGIVDKAKEAGVNTTELGKAIGNFTASTNKSGKLSKSVYDNIKQHLDALPAQVRDSIKEMQRLEQQMSKLNQQEEASVGNIRRLEEATANYKNSLKEISSIEVWVSGAASVNQLAFAIQSLSNIARVWENDQITTGEKILQTFTNLSSAALMTLHSFSGLTSVLTGLSQKLLATDMASKGLDVLWASLIDKNGALNEVVLRSVSIAMARIGMTEKEIVAELMAKKVKEANAVAAAKEAVAIAGGAKAKEAYTLATFQATVSTQGFRAALQGLLASNPVGWIMLAVSALVALGAAFVAAIKHQDEMRKATIARSKETLEEYNNIKALKEEYEELYEGYKVGAKTKEDMIDISKRINEALGDESLLVKSLAGDWEGYSKILNSTMEDQIAAAKAAATAMSEATIPRANRRAELIGGTVSIAGTRTDLEDDLFKNYEDLFYNELKSTQLKLGFTEEEQLKSAYRIGDFLATIDKEASAEWKKENEQFIEKLRHEYGGLIERYGEAMEAQTEVLKTTAADYSIKNLQTEINNVDELTKHVFELADQYEKAGYLGTDALEQARQFLAQNAEVDANIVMTLSYQMMLAEESDVNMEDEEAVKKFLEGEGEKIVEKLGGEEKFAVIASFVLELDEDLTIKNLEKAKSLVDNYFGGDELAARDFLRKIPLDFEKVNTISNLREIIAAAQTIADENKIKVAVETIGPIVSSGTEFTGVTEEQNKKLQENYGIVIDTNLGLMDQLKILREILEVERAKVGSKEEQEIAQYQMLIELIKAQQEAELKLAKIKDKNSEEWSNQSALVQSLNVEIQKLGESIADIDNQWDKTEMQRFIEDSQMLTEQIHTMSDITPLVGEGFVVASEDVDKLLKKLPELAEGATVLSDGGLKLDASIYNEVLQAQQDIINLRAADHAKERERLKLELQEKIDQKKKELKALEDFIAGKVPLDDALKARESKAVKMITDIELDGQEAKVKAAQEAHNKVMSYYKEEYDAIQVIAQARAAAAKGQVMDFEWSGFKAGEQGLEIEEFSTEERQKYFTEYTEEWQQAFIEAKNLVQEELDSLEADKAMLTLTEAAEKAAAAGKDRAGKERTDQLKKLELLEKEIDRYREINNQLKLIENQQNRLAKEAEKLAGAALLNNLDKQVNILHKQIAAQKQKLALQKQEVNETRKQLAQMGGNFDPQGNLKNYAALVSAYTDEVNNAIQNYNNQVNKESQEQWQKRIDEAKKGLERVKTLVNTYESTLYDGMLATQNAIQDAHDQIIDLQIEKFTIKVQVALDFQEATREWNKFKAAFINDKDLTEPITIMQVGLEDLFSYFNKAGTGTLDTLIKRLNEINVIVNKIRKGDFSTQFGDNLKKAEETQKDLYQQLIDAGLEYKDLVKEIEEAVLKWVDKSIEKFQDLNAQFQIISDTLEHQANLIELLYGEKAYDQLDKYYKAQAQNNNAQIIALRQQRDSLTQQRAALGARGSKGWTNSQEAQWKALTAAIDEAQSNINTLVEESLDNLISMYENAVTRLVSIFTKELTGGLELDEFEEQWRIINKNADFYLDKIARTYEINKLQSQFLESINATDSVTAQARLNALMVEQLKYLKEKDNLTQYDIDRAAKLFEIEQKRVAFQEAQQRKTTMALQRDSQGNLSYVYTADQNAVAKAEQELRAAEQDLYMMDKEQYKENLDEMYTAYKEWSDGLIAIAEDRTLTEEERWAKIEFLNEYYGGIINKITEDNETIKKNLISLGLEETDNLFNNSIQNMIDRIKGEGGIQEVAMTLYENITQAARDYAVGVDALEKSAQEDFDNIAAAIDRVLKRTGSLVIENDKLIDSFKKEANSIDKLIDRLKVFASWVDAVNGLSKAAAAASAVRTSEEAARAATAAQTAQGKAKVAAQTAGDAVKAAERAVIAAKKYLQTANLLPSGDQQGDGTYEDYVEVSKGRWARVLKDKNGKIIKYLTGGNYLEFATGGYTGDWASGDGRLAMLHKKELVLNQADTVNLLKTMDSLRDITKIIGVNAMNQNNNLISSLAGVPAIGSMGPSQFDQNVSIEAIFPSVTSAIEIQTALEGLKNKASQYVFKSKQN